MHWRNFRFWLLFLYSNKLLPLMVTLVLSDGQFACDWRRYWMEKEKRWSERDVETGSCNGIWYLTNMNQVIFYIYFHWTRWEFFVNVEKLLKWRKSHELVITVECYRFNMSHHLDNDKRIFNLYIVFNRFNKSAFILHRIYEISFPN